ncbi:MAG: putative toxin-antitoxin system toxin component, PIN family [Chromatiales bacterium]
MRVILDTNVVLSALIKVDSKPYKLVQAWLDGRFELVSSAAQLEEITRVSRYPEVRRFIEPAEVGWLVNRVRERAVLAERLPKVDASTDPGDNFLLAMAEAADSDYLVTGDKAGLLVIKKHGRTQVVTVSRMLATLTIR